MALRDSLIEGHLSGAEMAVALEPQSPIQLHGLEDPAVYLENIMAYEQVEELRPAALRELETARLMQTSLDLDSGKWTTDADGLLRRMLQLRMKPVDYAAYLQQPYKDQSGSALSEALQAAEKFYRVADKRSHWFLKILESAPASGPHMAVVGGYHTALMAEELEHEGISYVVLTPHITQSGYDELYARGMQSTISALKLRE